MSRRRAHACARRRYSGREEMTRTDFRRRFGTKRTMPLIGLSLSLAKMVSSSCATASGSAEFERVDAERHAAHPIDVEHADGVHDGVEVRARARDDQQIAGGVGAQKVRIGRDRLQDALHLRRRHVLQRHDLGGDAGHAPVLAARALEGRGGDRFADRKDAVGSLLHDDRRALAAQDIFEDLKQRFPRNGLGRLDRDGALDLLADGVGDAQHVAEDRLGRLRDAGLDDVERDAILARAHDRARRGLARSAARCRRPRPLPACRKSWRAGHRSASWLASAPGRRNGQRQLLPGQGAAAHRHGAKDNSHAPQTGDRQLSLPMPAADAERLRGGRARRPWLILQAPECRGTYPHRKTSASERFRERRGAEATKR